MEKNKKNATVSTRKVLVVSFLVDLSDLVLNFIVAVLSGSVVMISQTLQGGSDALASGLMLFGYRRSRRPSDKNYPFGYGREMYFWTMISTTVMLGITATMSIYLGFTRFINPQTVENISLAFIMLAFGMLTNLYAFSLSYRKIIKDRPISQLWHAFSDSPAIETKTSLVQDLMGTLASILGIAALGIFEFTGDYKYDGLGAVAIGAMIGVLSIFLLDALRDMIVGRKASDKIEKQIRHAALKFSEVEEILGLKTMYLGPSNILVNIEVHLVHKLTTRRIEKLIDEIKLSIKSEVPSVKHVQVELETPDS